MLDEQLQRDDPKLLVGRWSADPRWPIRFALGEINQR